MKIRSKLFMAFIIIAGLSTFLATFFAIYSISQNYEDIASEETQKILNKAENFFYEYLGDLTRKAVFISELKEIVDNMQNPNELFINLENKGFFLYNINTKILDPDLKIIASFENSSESLFNEENLLSLPVFRKDRDPLIRDMGIFKFKERICILATSPIVDQVNFSFKGSIFFESYLNSEFADQLKEKTGCEIIINAANRKLASSLQDEEGKRYFPEFSEPIRNKSVKFRIFQENYLVDRFPINDYFDNKIGEVFIAVNIKNIVVAKSQVIKNLLIVVFLVVLVVIGISLLTGRWLTKPILKLSSAAEAVSKGDFNIQIKKTSGDEIGHLSEVFMRMVESIRSQREEILDLKMFFEKVIHNSPSALIICDEAGGIITINPATEKIFRTEITAIKGKDVFDAFQLPPSIKADFYKVIFSGNPTYHDSYPLFLPSKEEKIFRLTLYKIILKRTISVALQIEDVTERLQMEEELTHAQKLGTLGEVLSRFTHEFNNLMTGIIGHINLLKFETDANSGGYARIASIEELASKAQNLGKNILSFSRKEKYETETIDITELIDSVLSLVEKTILKDVQVEKNIVDSGLFIEGNRERLSLAFFNLLINAKDAITETDTQDGKIVISVNRESPQEKRVRIIKIDISDNGIGIQEKHLEKIFLPYFSTKGRKGTGIGLSTVKQIVENIGGEVVVSSRYQVGTTFSLKIPESSKGN